MSKPAPCDYCIKASAWIVAREVMGAWSSLACPQHLGVALVNLLKKTGSTSACVYPVEGGRELDGEGRAAADRAAETVRRIGAFSAKEPETARVMEYELYRGTLALIAQGSPGAAHLALTALQSQNYHFPRSW